MVSNKIFHPRIGRLEQSLGLADIGQFTAPARGATNL